MVSMTSHNKHGTVGWYYSKRVRTVRLLVFLYKCTGIPVATINGRDDLNMQQILLEVSRLVVGSSSSEEKYIYICHMS